MNTLEIKQALESNKFTKRNFSEVYAADELPKSLDTFPCGFIANTDPSTKPGTHWVAFYFSSHEKGEFFDSYGYSPKQYKFFKFYKPEIWNDRKLQSSFSEVCGQYCIFYLYHKSRGYSMSKIVNMFTDNTSLNDCNVACYVKKHFNVTIKNQPICGLNQCCKSILLK